MRSSLRASSDVSSLTQAVAASSQKVSSLNRTLEVQQALLFSMFEIRDLRVKIAELLRKKAPNLSPEQVAEIAVVFATAYVQNPRMRPSMLLAVVQQESGFNPSALSDKGAIGLMQVMPATARPYLRQLGLPEDPLTLYDPVVNVKVATLFLEDLLRTYPEDEVAINAYFWGSGNINYFIATGKQRVADLKYGAQVLEKAQENIKLGLV